jgi:hypothetical protein
MILVCVAALGATAFAGRASAQNVSPLPETLVFIHGWKAAVVDHNYNHCQDQTSCEYWDNEVQNFQGRQTWNEYQALLQSSCGGKYTPGCSYQLDQAWHPNRHVGWNAQTDWRSSGVINKALAVLNSHCRRDLGQSCSIICHSTGCPIAGKTLALYGNGGQTWNINRVLTLGSAEGGTELADFLNTLPGTIGLLFAGWSGLYLQPSVVRSAYDHNVTAGVPFFHVAGYDGGDLAFATSTIITGEDDGVVPLHSACGYVKAFQANYCSNDWEWVRKTSWGIPYYVMRTVSQWSMHKRVEACGRTGCYKTHGQIADQVYQALVFKQVP